VEGASGSAVQGVIGVPRDCLFDERKVVVEQSFGMPLVTNRNLALTDPMAISAAIRARTVLAVYSVMLIGLASLYESCLRSRE